MQLPSYLADTYVPKVTFYPKEITRKHLQTHYKFTTLAKHHMYSHWKTE